MNYKNFEIKKRIDLPSDEWLPKNNLKASLSTYYIIYSFKRMRHKLYLQILCIMEIII